MSTLSKPAYKLTPQRGDRFMVQTEGKSVHILWHGATSVGIARPTELRFREGKLQPHEYPSARFLAALFVSLFSLGWKLGLFVVVASLALQVPAIGRQLAMLVALGAFIFLYSGLLMVVSGARSLRLDLDFDAGLRESYPLSCRFGDEALGLYLELDPLQTELLWCDLEACRRDALEK